MNIDRFLYELPRLLLSSEGDEPYHVLRIMTSGMTTPRVAKVLNFATRYLFDHEFYCEIGSFSGYTMISASYANNSHVVGIDNFSFSFGLTGKTKEEIDLFRKSVKSNLGDNLEKLGSPSIEFIESDFRNVEFKKDKGHSMGVFFIDGEHTYDEVMASFKWGETYLSEDAIVILDDVNVPGVSDAIFDYLKDHKEYEMIFQMKPTGSESLGRYRDEIIHNGITILKYKRKRV